MIRLNKILPKAKLKTTTILIIILRFSYFPCVPHRPQLGNPNTKTKKKKCLNFIPVLL